MTHNTTPHSTRASHSVTLASLMLPGLAVLASLTPLAAAAEGAPEKTTIAVKYGSYNDSQPGWERIQVSAPSVYIPAPIASDWSIEASGVVDSVAGASTAAGDACGGTGPVGNGTAPVAMSIQ